MCVPVTPSLRDSAVRETVLPVCRRHLVCAATYRRISQIRSVLAGLAFLFQVDRMPLAVSICPEYVELKTLIPFFLF